MGRIVDDVLGIEGRIGGLTSFVRNGKKYTRKSTSHQPRRLTPKQLALREQIGHNNALWRALKSTNYVFFEGADTAYNRFMSINRESPIPYLEKRQYHSGNALLLPNMVISDGPLTPINYQLDEVDGKPALFTDLTKTAARKGTLLLYVLKQNVFPWYEDEDTFQLHIEVETITPNQFTVVPSTLDTPYQNVHGTLALVDDRFADPMMGFGLVRVQDGHASSQHVVTRCTYYERYTTEEAIQAAAKSYGGFSNAE